MKEIKKSDNKLVISVLNGEINVFAEIVERYEKLVFSFLISRRCSLQEAEDIVQETFIKAYKHLASFDRKRKFSSWLLTIARNIFIDHCRKSGRTLSSSEMVTDWLNAHSIYSKNDEPQEVVIRKHNLSKVINSIFQLNEDLRVPFIMLIVEEKSYQEIADALEIPLQTVKNRIFKARQVLRRQRQNENEMP